MTLSAGTRLGPYEIVSLLGAGGMGEVYRAIDTRLDRAVALKVLPRELSETPGFRQRFEREAKAISQLSHPNICALFDLGSEGGAEYLVMELLEGQTLADRLEKGPLPIDQVLRFGTEIAAALDRAHRAGIVHRDLKPGNVMLTRTGVKLLDFGLAKAVAKAPVEDGSGLSALPTAAPESRPLTEEGTILGTFQYMAPEQVEGREADARTDIFALGCVLYEMATGRKAFTGRSRAGLVAAILERDPGPISAALPMAPPALDRLVQGCLEKDPDDRWQSAHDVMAQLRWIAQGGSQAGVPAPVTARRRSRERTAWIAAGLAVIAAIGFAAAWLRRAPANAGVVRSTVLPPAGSRFAFSGDNAGPLTISPDGKTLAFLAVGNDRPRLYVRPLDADEPVALPGADGASFPFWSPDSRSLGFFADGKLKRVDLSAPGSSTTICAAPNARGGTWGADGTILFAPDTRSAIFRVPASGGTPSPVTKLDASSHSTHRWPAFLPDGRHFLFFAGDHNDTRSDKAGARFASIDAPGDRAVVHTLANALYAGGKLLFLRGNTLIAESFDPRAGNLSGEPRPVAEGVHFDL
ncbi:MAG TPA: protein kinase, partial [Thermoanaerobaculia bacterium]|nr:protein kinase [Thermoanaerobaculia bacterium]